MVVALGTALTGFPARWNAALHALVLVLLPWVVVRLARRVAARRRGAPALPARRSGVFAALCAATFEAAAPYLMMAAVLGSAPSAYYTPDARLEAGALAGLPVALACLAAALALGELWARAGAGARTLRRVELGVALAGTALLLWGGAGTGGPLDVLGTMAWRGGPAQWVAPWVEGAPLAASTQALGGGALLLACTLGVGLLGERLGSAPPDPWPLGDPGPPDVLDSLPRLQLPVVVHAARAFRERWGALGLLALAMAAPALLEVGTRLAGLPMPGLWLATSAEGLLLAAAVVVAPEWTPSPPGFARLPSPEAGRSEAARAFSVGLVRVATVLVPAVFALLVTRALGAGHAALLLADGLGPVAACLGLSVGAVRIPGGGLRSALVYLFGLALVVGPHLALSPLLALLGAPGSPPPLDLSVAWVLTKALLLALSVGLGVVVPLVYCDEWREVAVAAPPREP